MMYFALVVFMTLVVGGIATAQHNERESEGMRTYMHNEYNMVYPRH